MSAILLDSVEITAELLGISTYIHNRYELSELNVKTDSGTQYQTISYCVDKIIDNSTTLLQSKWQLRK